MATVMYENRNAIFDFELPDVIERLKYYSDQNVHEATEILDAIFLCTSEAMVKFGARLYHGATWDISSINLLWFGYLFFIEF